MSQEDNLMTEKSKVPGVYCHDCCFVCIPTTDVCTSLLNLQRDTILGLDDGKGGGPVLKHQMM